jgi:hypothetical protein
VNTKGKFSLNSVKALIVLASAPLIDDTTKRRRMNTSYISHLISRRWALAGLACLAIPALAGAESVVAPAGVASLAPAGTKLIFFKASGDANGADAVAVFESAAPSNGAQRNLLVLRKQDGGFRVVDRNDKLIACATCGQFKDDPFLNDGSVTVTPGHIRISQMDSGETQSGVVYDFAFDAATSKWKVLSGERTVAADMGHGPAKTQKATLPVSGLLKDVDGQWQSVSYWNGVVVNNQTHRMSTIFSVSSEKELDSELKKSCDDASACHVIVKQHDGCFAVAKDGAQAFFPATVAKKRAKAEAASAAMADCKAKGTGECEVQRSGCSTGFE